MAERNQLTTSGHIGGDADSRSIEKVYVGIPDVLTPDQLIRFHSLSFALGEIKFLDEEREGEVLDRAEKFATFIRNGSKG